jgi:X-X-X-Leu-X-X-Gly heptad repeat protein
MSRFTIRTTLGAGWSRRTAALFLVVLATLFAQPRGQAQTVPISLPYTNGFLVTGNFGLGTVDLPNASSTSGFLTGTINISQAEVPSGSHVLAAFLFWETITSQDPGVGQQQLTGAKFRGLGVDVVNMASATLTGGTASCWSSGGGSQGAYTMNMLRADVKRLLPVDPTGRLLVNDQELTANGYPLHTVTLPEAGTGNQVPQSAGATLVVVWWNQSEPLRRIVFNEGIGILPNVAGAKLEQTIRGIYQSSATKSARLAMIGGSGQPNATDRWFFKNTQIAGQPFRGTSSASDRSWSSPTADVSTLMPGTTTADGYGETVTATLDHTSTTPYDCVSLAAVIFSAAVKDDDRDGIADGVEDRVATKDPDGTALPDLPATVSSAHKNILIQMDAMQAAAGTSYGSVSAPYNSKKCIAGGDMSECTVTDTIGHNHMPTPGAVKIVIDAYKNAPIVNTGWPGADNSTGIFPLLDVGNPATYIAALAADGDYSPYFVPAAQARGGNIVQELAPSCSTPPCQFAAFPGTVGWLDGFLGQTSAFFDRTREGTFRQVFYVHARGFPKSLNPCLVPTSGANPDGSCTAVNPDFYVPWSQSGVAQNPGGKAMVSLGFWDKINFVGGDELQGAVTLHELGHTVYLQHGGPPPVQTATSLYYEPNCKPNYLSVMNYSFVIDGVRDNNGKAHFDYSRDTYSTLSEPSLTDGVPLSPLRYRTAWFARLDSPLAVVLGATRSKRFCSGEALPFPLPNDWVDMARVEIQNTANTIDWNGDFDLTDSGFSQDVTFDGVLSGSNNSLRGFNDWNNLRLDLIGNGEAAAGLSQGSLRLGAGFILLPDGSRQLADGSKLLADGSKVLADGSKLLADGSKVLADGSRQLADGSRQLADGSIRLADGSRLLADGSRQLADGSRQLADGSKALADGSIKLDEGIQEHTTEHFADVGHSPPRELTGCVIGTNCGPSAPSSPLHRTFLEWKTPTAANVAGGGTLVGYHVFRARGTAITSTSVIFQLTTVPVTALTYVDTEELPNNIDFVYYVKALFDDGSTSFASNNAIAPNGNPYITAVNTAPVAVADAGPVYTTVRNTALNVPAPGVLGNDTDVDSPATSRSAVRVIPPSLPSGHTVTLNPDGSFLYQPKNGFTGTVFFDYVVKPGTYTRDLPNVPMSPDSNVVRVTIIVNAPR